MQPQTPVERRSNRSDRRSHGPGRPPASGERRVGPRRQLPRSRWQQWPSLLASAALGVIAAVSLQSLAEPTPAAWAANLPARVTPRSVAPLQLPRFTAEEAATMRDEAEALTPAAVALDETAAQRWWPLRGELDAAAEDPATPAPVREDLQATRAALDRLGL